MEQTLRQVSELLLGAVPTAVILLLLYVAYHFLVHKPLAAVLAERRNRTEGAVEKARADIAAAEAKTAEYEARLREAKVAIFKQQDARRKQAQEARMAAVAAARAKAEQQVEHALTALQQDVAAAKTGLQSESERLASEIIRAILQSSGAGQVPATGGHQ
jgi:F-type H+-transporting ATPase subunit b